MPASIRPYVTAGVALVGASVISVTPIQPSQPQIRVASDPYSLMADSVPGAPGDPTGDGLACTGYHTDQCDINAPQYYTPIVVDTNDYAFRNILPNLLNAVVSVPRAYLDAINDVAWSMEVTGSWWVYTPTNVLGYDPADPAKITSITNLLIPFAALSNPLGEHLSWWAKANLPMSAGCTGTAPPVCKHADQILEGMFLAPIWDLIAGYTFPALNNPVSAEEGQAGEEIPGSEGTPVPWSGAHIQINPYDPVWNVVNYLFADPEQNRPEKITLAEVTQTLVRLGKGLFQDFYPFVPGSFLWKGAPYTLVTPFLKPFVKILCPKCDPEHPEDPTPFDGVLPPTTQDKLDDSTPSGTSLLAKFSVKGDEAATEETAKKAAPTADAPAHEKDGVVATAVTNLLKKFSHAPAEQPAAADTEVKTDSGTPVETKPVQTPQDETATSDDDTKPSDDSAGTHKKKWTIGGGKHRDTEKTSDRRSARAAAKSSEGASDSGSGASSAGSTAGAANNGGGSAGGAGK